MRLRATGALPSEERRFLKHRAYPAVGVGASIVTVGMLRFLDAETERSNRQRRNSRSESRRCLQRWLLNAIPIHILSEDLGHSKIDMIQAFHLAAETRNTDAARDALSAFIHARDTPRSRRT